MPWSTGEPCSAPPAPQDETICPWPGGPGTAEPKSSDANTSCTETCHLRSFCGRSGAACLLGHAPSSEQVGCRCSKDRQGRAPRPHGENAGGIYSSFEL